MNGFIYPRPWRISLNNGMVSLIAANNAVVTEILPSQYLGEVPTIAVKVAIAEEILLAMNAQPAQETTTPGA